MTKEISRGVAGALANQPEPIERIENEPPAGAACGACRFSREMRAGPGEIMKRLGCKKNPPTVVVGMIGGQPAIVGAAFPPVHEQEWCYSFEPQAGYSPILKNS